MDMKNTVILLIFLLSILGLIIGVQYTVDDTDEINQNGEEDVHIESKDTNIIAHLQKKENESSIIDKLLS